MKYLLYFLCFTVSIALAQPSCQVYFGNKKYICSFGRNGVSTNKVEGDGTTPVGEFPLRKVYFRRDQIKSEELVTQLPTQIIQVDDGWCDDVNSPTYNQYVKLPISYRHENLWLPNHVYDIIVVVGYNDQPVVKNKGSAIFLHIARAGYPPTAGCIAFSKNDLLEILSKITPETKIKIQENGVISFSEG